MIALTKTNKPDDSTELLLEGVSSPNEVDDGEIYHLYLRGNGEKFFSVIAPNQCNYYPLATLIYKKNRGWTIIK